MNRKIQAYPLYEHFQSLSSSSEILEVRQKRLGDLYSLMESGKIYPDQAWRFFCTLEGYFEAANYLQENGATFASIAPLNCSSKESGFVRATFERQQEDIYDESSYIDFVVPDFHSEIEGRPGYRAEVIARYKEFVLHKGEEGFELLNGLSPISYIEQVDFNMKRSEMGKGLMMECYGDAVSYSNKIKDVAFEAFMNGADIYEMQSYCFMAAFFSSEIAISLVEESVKSLFWIYDEGLGTQHADIDNIRDVFKMMKNEKGSRMPKAKYARITGVVFHLCNDIPIWQSEYFFTKSKMTSDEVDAKVFSSQRSFWLHFPAPTNVYPELMSMDSRWQFDWESVGQYAAKYLRDFERKKSELLSNGIVNLDKKKVA